MPAHPQAMTADTPGIADVADIAARVIARTAAHWDVPPAGGPARRRPPRTGAAPAPIGRALRGLADMLAASSSLSGSR